VPILRSAADWAADWAANRPTRRGRRDPRVAGLRRHARIVVTGWVMCVLPLLVAGFGYMLLRLPAIDRSLWRAASVQAHLMTAAAGGHRYATAAVAAVGAALLGVSLAGSAYVITGLVRRGVSAGLHWSAGRPARRLRATAALLAVAIALAAFWTANGQLRGW
jgi:putative peptide zinc metalloprotease protein